ncbi:MAG: sporulation transcriptional regulator SpoIIID, partial [Clostridia bacterium]|nr:sporulation transcriptional regulator SpoIIID [Clostridia bacterium]
KEVKRILGINLEERHLRGGESTKRKYKELR